MLVGANRLRRQNKGHTGVEKEYHESTSEEDFWHGPLKGAERIARLPELHD